ncbi:MAG: HAMP domain-containing sensor histidine kinase [bacterium]
MAKTPALKTQLILVFLGLFLLLAIGAFFSFRHQRQSLRALENSFQEDLGVVSQIPQLAEVMRRIDFSTEEFLLSQNANLLAERSSSVAELKKIMNGLEVLAKDPQLQEPWRLFKEKTGDYLGLQEQWIKQRQRGELSGANTLDIILAQSPANALESMADHIKEVKVARLDAQRRSTQRASLYTLSFSLAGTLVAGLVLALALRGYVLRPLGDLQQDIRTWTAGCDWPSGREPSNLEFQKIRRQLQDMAARINEQFNQELELRKLKSQLVSWISHELGNGLSIIGNATDLLQESDERAEEEDRAKLYRMIQGRIQALSLTSLNLLNLGKAEAGKLRLQVGPTELPPLLASCLEAMRFLADRKHLHLKLNCQAGLPAVRADEAALQLVLQNLLSNALKYTPEGGEVEIGCCADLAREPKVEIFVNDTGIGIAPSDQGKILQGYYRSEEGRAMAEGHGVGLAMVEVILAAHGSKLALESAPGKGTRASFRLPLAA